MRKADGPTAESVVHVAAPPETVWALASDIHLVAESSLELQEVSWQDGAEGPALGHRFRGRNVHRQVGEWETVSQIIECEAGKAFTWAVMDPDNPTATWGFSLAPDGEGTRLRQWAQMGPGPSNLDAVVTARPEMEERIVEVRMGEWRAGMERTLAFIKERAER